MLSAMLLAISIVACPSSPFIIGGRFWQALQPNRFLTGCWLLPRWEVGALHLRISRLWPACII